MILDSPGRKIQSELHSPTRIYKALKYSNLNQYEENKLQTNLSVIEEAVTKKIQL